MYSYEDRMRAVALYIKYNMSIASVTRELGYPSRQMLYLWYKEYNETGALRDDKSQGISKYTKWLTDITEFNISAGKIYLSPIVDCFDGMAVSWTIGTSPDAEMVNSMLDAAVSLLGEDEHPVIHSDRGGHYRWPGWIERMQKAELTRSMSKRAALQTMQFAKASSGGLKTRCSMAGRRSGYLLTTSYIHWTPT